MFSRFASSSSSSSDAVAFTIEDLKNRWHNNVCAAYGPINEETGLVFSRLADILLHSASKSASPEEGSLKRKCEYRTSQT